MEVIEKRMGITVAEFRRLVGRFLEGRPHRADEGGFTLDEGDGRRFVCRVEALPERVMSPIVTLPMTRVELRLEGYAGAEREALLADFDMRFRRGGG